MLSFTGNLTSFIVSSNLSKYSLNLDLYLSIKKLIDQIVSEYTGRQYEKDFYTQLNKMGVVIPIRHDDLHTFGLLYLFNSKQRNNLAYEAAIKFYTDIFSKNVSEYSSYVRKESFDDFQALLISTVETDQNSVLRIQQSTRKEQRKS